MNDIEVGEQVRTNDGKIGKLLRIERDDIDNSLKWYVFHDGKNERYVNKPYIVSHSKNIIDLIEVGDYVNGKKVERINDYGEHKRADFNLDFDDYDAVYEEDIRSILTKEQFNKAEFIVSE